MEFVKGKPMFIDVSEEKYKRFPKLLENLETEIIIVGGGVSGCILSYYFSKAGVKVILLEENKIASKSTSVTTALLEYELDDNVSILRNKIDEQKIIKAYKLCNNSLKEIENFINIYGNECDYIKRDCLLYTEKKDEIAELKNEYNFRKKYEFDVEYIDEKNNMFPFNVKAGVYSKNGGAELNPYKFCHQLLKVAEKNKAKIYEDTKVVSYHYKDEFIEIETDSGYKVKGKKLIVATGYNTKIFTDRIFSKNYITFNIVTKPLENFNWWKNRVLIRDNSNPYLYIRSTKDNRIIIGGEDIELKGEDFCSEQIANEKYEALIKKLTYLFKEYDFEIDYKYCGVFATTQDNLGFIGKENDDKLWYCLGYGANGLLFSMIGGKMLLDLYQGKEVEELNLFSLNR